jgi:uncharacterized protein (DUF58 family)
MPNRRNIFYILTILSLLTGLFTGRAVFFNVAILLIAILVLSLLWSWMAVRWVGISRRTRARRAQVGRALEEGFAVRNIAFLPKLWLEVRDHSDLPGHQASHVVPTLLPAMSYKWQASTLCCARGEFRLGPMTVSSGDPFGLFITPRSVGSTSRILVYPQTVSISRFEMPMGVMSGGEAQRKRSPHVTTNAAGLRDYVAGDSFSRIHWKSSARKDDLMVKEFEIDPLVDVWLMVDFSAASLVEPTVQRVGGIGPVITTTPTLPPSTEEYAAAIGASLAQHFMEKERSLGFVAYTPHRESLEAERGARQQSRILELLAVARSTSPYTLAQVLIVTAARDAQWVAQAQTLARKGVRPMCVLIDAHSFDPTLPTSDEVRGFLRVARIPTLVVRCGDPLEQVLTTRPI